MTGAVLTREGQPGGDRVSTEESLEPLEEDPSLSSWLPTFPHYGQPQPPTFPQIDPEFLTMVFVLQPPTPAPFPDTAELFVSCDAQ